MNLAIQMTLFFSLSLLFLTIEKNQRTLMQQKSSRLIQSVCLITSITLASLLSLYLYLWLPELPPVFNVVIADVFLLSLVSFAISLFFCLDFSAYQLAKPHPCPTVYRHPYSDKFGNVNAGAFLQHRFFVYL